MWIVLVSESFNDVERRPRITWKRDEWLRTEGQAAEVDGLLFSLGGGFLTLASVYGQLWLFVIGHVNGSIPELVVFFACINGD